MTAAIDSQNSASMCASPTTARWRITAHATASNNGHQSLSSPTALADAPTLADDAEQSSYAHRNSATAAEPNALLTEARRTSETLKAGPIRPKHVEIYRSRGTDHKEMGPQSEHLTSPGFSFL